MREQLIRYLLGELDEDERREVRALLRDNPELQKELAHLRECFAENQDDATGPSPPRHLAERTADTISNSDEYELEQMARSKTMTAISEPPTGILGWSLADLTVAGGVMIAVSMLVFPALRESREGTRRNVCVYNQSQVGMVLARFAADHNRYFPRVGPKEYAGVILLRVLMDDYAQPGELQQFLLCPAAPIASDATFTIPGPDDLRKMSRADRATLASRITPCYAIRIPYRDANGYQDIRDEQSPYVPVLSDASGGLEQRISPNHRGMFIQILFQDCHVKTFTSSSLPGCDDNIFANRYGVVGVGDGPNDFVLAPPYVMPDPTADDSESDEAE